MLNVQLVNGKIMKNVRLNLTNDEKMAQKVIGSEGTLFNVGETNIDKLMEKENAVKFNEQLDKYVEDFAKHNQDLEEISKNMGVDPTKLEIKPMSDHLLIKPFEHNPFQKITIESGIITDTGGFKANIEKNPMTGKYEEQVQVIMTGCVMEVGPEVKYIKPGDVVFFHRRNILPIPFFKQGFYDLGEFYVLAVVNEDLTTRFNNARNGTNK